MLWWQHLFALWLLGHMLWACVLLQREWRRVRGFGPAAMRGVPLRIRSTHRADTQARTEYGAPLFLQLEQARFFTRPAHASRPANDNSPAQFEGREDRLNAAD